MKMKALSVVLITLISTSAMSQDLLPTKIINTRTKEVLAISCIEKQDDTCTKIQYMVATNLEGPYYPHSKINRDLPKLRLELQKEASDLNVLESDRLLVLSEKTQASMFAKGEEHGKTGGYYSDIAIDIYRRGPYQSKAGYALKAAGETLVLLPIAAAGAIFTGMTLAADIAIMPVRLAAKALGVKPYYYKGKKRKSLKKIIKAQDQVLEGDGSEHIYLDTHIWYEIWYLTKKLK